jgi:hypothetical protein
VSVKFSKANIPKSKKESQARLDHQPVWSGKQPVLTGYGKITAAKKSRDNSNEMFRKSAR